MCLDLSLLLDSSQPVTARNTNNGVDNLIIVFKFNSDPRIFAHNHTMSPVFVKGLAS
jgi:hypothetical protein